MAAAAPAVRPNTEGTPTNTSAPADQEPWRCDRVSGTVVKLDDETTRLLEQLARWSRSTPELAVSLSVRRACRYLGIV